jgi:hypothetical protein
MPLVILPALFAAMHLAVVHSFGGRALSAATPRGQLAAWLADR